MTAAAAAAAEVWIELETHLLNADHRKFKEHGHTNLEKPSLFLR